MVNWCGERMELIALNTIYLGVVSVNKAVAFFLS